MSAVWVALAAIGALATALITLGILGVELTANLHDRAMSGTRRPIIAKRATQSLGWIDFNPTILADWDRADLRWVSVRLVNRARFPIAIAPAPIARLGVFRRIVEVGSKVATVPPDDPQTVILILNRPGGWGKQETCLLSFRWEGAGEKIPFRRRVHLRPVPPVDGSPLSASPAP